MLRKLICGVVVNSWNEPFPAAAIAVSRASPAGRSRSNGTASGLLSALTGNRKFVSSVDRPNVVLALQRHDLGRRTP